MLNHEQLLEIADGNLDACNFLEAFQLRAHLLDDIADQDKEVTDTLLVDSEVDWLVTLSSNPFFLQHSAHLLPVMILGLNAWRDSNRWRLSTDSGKRGAADVLKGFYHEVAYAVAFLTGGMGHLAMMTAKFREYDMEAK